MTGGYPAIGLRILMMVVCSAWSVLAWSGTQVYGTVDVAVEMPEVAGTGIGYRAASVVLSNNGTATRDIRLEFPAISWDYGYGDYLRSVTRSFRVEPGQTVRAEMIMPPLPINGEDVAVFIDGNRQRRDVDLRIQTDHYSGDNEIGVLVSRDINRPVRDRLAASVERHADALRRGGGTGWSSGRRLGRAEVSILLGEPIVQWSTAWQTYTGYGAVVVSERDVRTMPTAVAAALRKYVLDGGLMQVVMPSPGMPVPPSWPSVNGQDVSPVKQRGSVSRPLGLGRVEWMSSDVVAAWPDDQGEAWVEVVLARTSRLTTNFTAEQADRALPVIEQLQTPVRGLLVVMVVFAILIGPVNVLILVLIKRRMWLLWTVPVIAALFSGLVVVYALLSEGVTPSARTQAVTWLDQTTRESVTVAMRGYYTPLTPGDGLRFGMETVVIPQVGLNDYFYGNRGGGARTINLTTEQHLSRGWVSARVPTYFELRTVETRRERLVFERLEDGELAVTNGLGVDVERLQVIDHDGQVWFMDALPAGQKGLLEAGPNTDTLGGADGHADLDDFGRLALNPADHIAAPQGWQFGQSARVRGTAKPGTYVALMSASPFVADGLAELGQHRVAATVVGVWKEAR
ncbi:MAG: hypothetical protein AAF328_06695 [Planctomycetota bacterium]